MIIFKKYEWVWYMEGSVPVRSPITSMTILSEESMYFKVGSEWKSQNEIFKTKEELKNNVFKDE